MRILSPWTFYAFAGTLCIAQTHYFTTTAAGSNPSQANPIATKQYIDNPAAVAYDPHGNLYYANLTQVWRLNPDETDTLVAGRGPHSSTGGGGSTLAVDAAFNIISSMAFDPQGNLHIADGNVWKMTPDQNIFAILPLNNSYFPIAGAWAVTVDAAGNVYATGYTLPETVIKYPAGGQGWTVVPAQLDPTQAILDIAVSGSNLYFVMNLDVGTVRVLNLQTGGVAIAFQTPGASVSSGPVAGATIGLPSLNALAVGPDGAVYFCAQTMIFRANPQPGSAPQPFAGTAAFGYSGDGGLALQANMTLWSSGDNDQGALAVNPLNGDVVAAEEFNHVFRLISGATHIIQTVAGAPHFAGDNGPAVLAQFDATPGLFYGPGVLSADGAGNLYFFDRHNARIRKITESGIISTVAGNGIEGDSGDGGKATQAAISGIEECGNVAADKAGNLYFVNCFDKVTIRMVDLNGNIHTVAGGGSAPIANGAPATSVALSEVCCVAVNKSGNLYFAQSNNYGVGPSQIFKVASGNISLFAGTGAFGSSPDGASAASAQLGNIFSIAVDASGLVYFSDLSNFVVRMVNAQGNLVTIAGTGSYGNGSPVTAGAAKSTALDYTSSLAIDAAGNVYFRNLCNFGQQILAVDTAGNLTPTAGLVPTDNTAETSGGDGGDSLQAGFADILGLAIDPSGHVFVLDNGVYIRELSPYNPGVPPPYLLPGGVIGSGASLPAVQAVSPNGDATIYGGNFGITHTLAASDLVNGQVPTSLSGVCVTFGGTPAAMLGVYPNQINVQVPTLPPGPVTVQVTLNCGKSNAVTSNYSGVMAQTASPEFFTFLPDAVAGNNPVAAVNALTGALIGPPGLIAGATFVPAKAGDIVEAYGTGWGLTTPPFGLGVLPGAAGQLALPFTLTLGGTAVPASNIQYAGVAPCCAGLYQVNFTVPAGTPSGNRKLVITVGGIASPPNAYIMVN